MQSHNESVTHTEGSGSGQRQLPQQERQAIPESSSVDASLNTQFIDGTVSSSLHNILYNPAKAPTFALEGVVHGLALAPEVGGHLGARAHAQRWHPPREVPQHRAQHLHEHAHQAQW